MSLTESLVNGDQVSCSRVGGTMRRESSRLSRHAQSTADALGKLVAREPQIPDAAVAPSVRALRAAADALDEAGAALQRYATDLAEGHELGRRAERRVEGAGLLLDGTRVVEPWGPASAQEAERRRALLPEVQSRVDLATAHVGRARGRLQREMARLTETFSEQSCQAREAGLASAPPHGS